MSEARARILARLRQRPIEAVAPTSQVEAWAGGDLLGSFCEELQRWHGEFIDSTPSRWQQDLRHFLDTEGLEQVCTGRTLATELEADLRQSVHVYAEGSETGQPRLFDTMQAGICRARAGLARTGSLFVCPDADAPASVSLIPPLHITLLERQHLVPDLPDLLRSPHFPDPPPRNMLLITGPSKTADIQQTLAYGAHGPKRLVVVLL